jgi:hypothetical protein
VIQMMEDLRPLSSSANNLLRGTMADRLGRVVLASDACRYFALRAGRCTVVAYTGRRESPPALRAPAWCSSTGHKVAMLYYPLC